MAELGTILLSSKILAALLASLIRVANLGYYVYTIFKGQTKPHLYTWLGWGIIGLVIGIIQTIEGETYGAIPAYTAAFTCFVRVALAIPYGEKNITMSDKVSLFGCLGSILIWLVTNEPLASVLLLTMIDIFAYYPTYRKTWSKPMEEPIFSHFLFGFTNTLTIFGLASITVTTAAYPFGVAVASYGFVIYTLMRRKQLAMNGFAINKKEFHKNG